MDGEGILNGASPIRRFNAGASYGLLFEETITEESSI
jgi:hypothetical protein